MSENIYWSKNIPLDLKVLFWFTDKELKFFSLSKRFRYKVIEIPKKSWGIRNLHVPVYKLKRAQRIILNELLYTKTDSLLIKNVTWFIPWRSIIDNAKFHVWKRYILKIDIKDFFPSVTQNRIFWLFRKDFNLDYSTSMYLSWLCTYNNQLPQWAPTSPMLANLIARFLDYRILWVINSYNKQTGVNIVYSRYADDLTISYNKKLNINRLINYIFDIIYSEWFIPNFDKLALISCWKQQKVTWIVVNSNLWIWRKSYKKMKSLLYNVSQNWFKEEMLRWNKINWTTIFEEEQFMNVLRWHLAHVKNISPNYYEKLQKITLS